MVLYDFAIHMNREADTNQPDIIIKDFKKRPCTMLGVTVPADKNISWKQFDEVSKYKDLEVEVET